MLLVPDRGDELLLGVFWLFLGPFDHHRPTLEACATWLWGRSSGMQQGLDLRTPLYFVRM